METRVDITEPLTEICERLGLEYNFVKELVVTPMSVTATVYGKNEDGKKHVDKNGEVVTRQIEVAT